MLTGKRLEDYLAYAIHGTRTPRKPPGIAQAPAPARRNAKKPRRGPARDHLYRAWIRTLDCAACGAEGRSEAAHTGRDGGMRMKASDYSCIPLCPACHRTGRQAYHRLGRAAFERAHGIDCAEIAAALRAAGAKIMQKSA